MFTQEQHVVHGDRESRGLVKSKAHVMGSALWDSGGRKLRFYKSTGGPVTQRGRGCAAVRSLTRRLRKGAKQTALEIMRT